MTMHRPQPATRPAILLALLCLLCLLILSGCDDRTSGPAPVVSTRADVGVVVDDAIFDEPVRGLCVPGSRRCVTENSPMYEECDRHGATFSPGACDDGDVCRDGECVTFACLPGRDLCVGATTRATCDESGRAVKNRTGCEGEEVCAGGLCVDLCQQARESSTYIACEYNAVELPNLYREIPGTASAPFGIIVANPSRLLTSTVTVSKPAGSAVLLQEPRTLTPGPSYEVGVATDVRSEIIAADGTTEAIEEATDVVVPPGGAAVFLPDGGHHYLIESSRPVVAYQFSPYCCNFTATNDASLLLPRSTWGTRYRILGYPAWALGDGDGLLQAYISLVSMTNTTVRVESPVPLLRPGTFEEATELEFELRAGEPTLLETVATQTDKDADLSGTVVESDDPISVFTGHPCTFVPHDQWACDHLEEAVLPSSVLGSRYILTPARRRSAERRAYEVDRELTEATYWRIVADEKASIRFSPSLKEIDVLGPSNEATVDCLDLFAGDDLLLDPGEVCEFGTTEPATLESTGALIVGGVISGHQSTGVNYYGSQAGDPSLFILPPVEQFRRDYAFVTAPTFRRSYVTVAAPPSAPVTLNRRSIPQEQRLERKVVELGRQRWEVFTIALEPGVHALESEERFGIVVYAYDDYVSYAFTGGLDLLPKGADR